MKTFLGILLLAVLLVPALPAAEKPAAPILPPAFAGWQLQGAANLSRDPQIADPANAAVLKEYGFRDFESASYHRDDGRKLTLRAARFEDASGAYGAFTFYKTPEMLDEKIGDQASSLNTRVLFYRGNVLIDAQFDRFTAMSAAELRELADGLPLPPGGARNLPSLPAYLPRQSFLQNTTRYVTGSVTLGRVDSPLAADLVKFEMGAEVVLGKYGASAGEATLMLISYPTPQIATERLRAVDAARTNAGAASSAATPLSVLPVYVRRTGPILVIASGKLSESEARSLLASVNYDANVTWNENTSFSKKDNLANLLVNIIMLCAIVVLIALVAGVAFGGVRVLFHRVRTALGGEQRDEVEFIALHLSENVKEPSSRT